MQNFFNSSQVERNFREKKYIWIQLKSLSTHYLIKINTILARP